MLTSPLSFPGSVPWATKPLSLSFPTFVMGRTVPASPVELTYDNNVQLLSTYLAHEKSVINAIIIASSLKEHSIAPSTAS